MTDEQKRALEVLENVCTDDCVNKAFVVEPIKQLIQTQQEEINDLKWRNEIYVKSIKSHKSEIEKKDTLINTMQAEFERLENLEDNTDMLKLELQNKEKECQKYHDTMMELIAEKNEKNLIIVEIAKAWKQDDIRGVHEIIQYFTNKVKKELENDN